MEQSGGAGGRVFANHQKEGASKGITQRWAVIGRLLHPLRRTVERYAPPQNWDCLVLQPYAVRKNRSKIEMGESERQQRQNEQKRALANY